MRQSHKTILIWAILILMFVSIYSMFTDSSSKEKEVDVTQFRNLLSNKEEAAKIEGIRVEPRGHDDARYIVSMKNDTTKRVVYAEFPGAITKEIYDAGISYSVKSKDESSIWPQVLGIALTQGALLVPQYILAEVTLSFFGLGVGEPVPSWGNMLASLQRYQVLSSYWWMFVPGLALIPVFLLYYALADALHQRAAAFSL